MISVVGLAGFGAMWGVALAMGELDTLWVCLAVLASLAVLFDFRIGAVLLILLLPVSESSLFPHAILGVGGLNPINVLVAGTLLSYLLRGRVKGGAGLVPKQALWLFIVPITVAALIGARHADEILPSFYYDSLIHFVEPIGYLRDMFVKPMLMVLVALLIGAAVARSKKADSFIAPMVVSIWVMCLVAIGYVLASGVKSLGELAGTDARTFFMMGIGMHANDLGRLYAVAYALLLFTWAGTPSKTAKTVLVASMGVVTLALLLTFSRGAFLGFVVVNLLFLFWRFNAKTLALALLVATVAVFFMPGAVYDRVMVGFGIGGGDANAVSAGRVDEIWLPLAPELLRSPIWGNGLGSIMWADAMYAGIILPVTHPHNAYFEALLDLGLLGSGLLIAYFIHVWRGFRALGSNSYLSPAMRGFFQGAAAALISFAVSGTAGSSLTPKPEYCFLWMAIGMMYGQLSRRPAS
jgi:O-antigen ligase